MERLVRMGELRRMIVDPYAIRDSLFNDFEQSLEMIPQKARQFIDLEARLQLLDQESWEQLKGRIFPMLGHRHVTRGWRELFDALNETKAYSFLLQQGCTDIQFISPIENMKTPDIKALWRNRLVLCEVKTINVSDYELTRRTSAGVLSVSSRVTDELLQKVERTIVEAERQLRSPLYEPSERRIAYIVINFDDSLHEYALEYQTQIERHVAVQRVNGLEIELSVETPFYKALI